MGVLKPEKPLIYASDITDDAFETEETEKEVFEEYAKVLCEKLDSVKTNSCAIKRFLPNKSLKKALPASTELKKPGWEVTAATPPPPVYGDTKMVSLQESIKLQGEQHVKLKEIQLKNASERLASSQHSTMVQLLSVPGTYRDPGSENSSDGETSEAEVHDFDDYPDKGGVVFYNLVDDTSNS